MPWNFFAQPSRSSDCQGRLDAFFFSTIFRRGACQDTWPFHSQSDLVTGPVRTNLQERRAKAWHPDWAWSLSLYAPINIKGHVQSTPWTSEIILSLFEAMYRVSPSVGYLSGFNFTSEEPWLRRNQWGPVYWLSLVTWALLLSKRWESNLEHSPSFCRLALLLHTVSNVHIGDKP